MGIFCFFYINWQKWDGILKLEKKWKRSNKYKLNLENLFLLFFKDVFQNQRYSQNQKSTLSECFLFFLCFSLGSRWVSGVICIWNSKNFSKMVLRITHANKIKKMKFDSLSKDHLLIFTTYGTVFPLYVCPWSLQYNVLPLTSIVLLNLHWQYRMLITY